MGAFHFPIPGTKLRSQLGTVFDPGYRHEELAGSAEMKSLLSILETDIKKTQDIKRLLREKLETIDREAEPLVVLIKCLTIVNQVLG